MATPHLSFVKGPPEEIEIECPICLQVMLDDPHLVSCCGHHFCGPCIRRVKDDNKPCPYCKEKEFQIFPDKGRLRYINGLQVNCTNEGCMWKGELKSLQSHINREKREGECQFEVVECKYDECEVNQQRRHLKIHEEKKCDQRPYDCQYCRHKGTYQYITQQHYPQCIRYPVPCPNKCQSDKFPRGDIEGHLSTVCPLQPVECEFKWAGCHYSPLRKDLRQHNILSKSNHMSLLAKSCGELKKRNDELMRDNGELKFVCQGLERDNEELKVTCQGLEKDNGELKVVSQELKRDNDELNRDNGELKVVCQGLEKDNEELKVTCQELKKENDELNRDNGELKVVCQGLEKDNEELKVTCQKHNVDLETDYHKYPPLPITVSRSDEDVRYFYSKPCGHLMSVEVEFGYIISIKVYKGKFQKSQIPLVTEIVIEYRDRKGTTTSTITKDNCRSYKDTFDERNDILQEIEFVHCYTHEFNIISIN